jgi:hypothetical protein
MQLKRIDLKSPRLRYGHDIIAVHEGPCEIFARIGVT